MIISSSSTRNYFSDITEGEVYVGQKYIYLIFLKRSDNGFLMESVLVSCNILICVKCKIISFTDY